jgi:hypothetical protein
MKNALLLSLALFYALTTSAQTNTLMYNFDYGYNEIYWRGPSLTSKCLPYLVGEPFPIGTSQGAHHFPKGCGLMYNDATKNFIASGSYTIEMYFRLDTVSGFKKIVDFDSLSKDKGFYVQNGKIVLYPPLTFTDSYFVAATYRYLAITRDASTNFMYVNSNGVTVGTYMDNMGYFEYDSSMMLIFFQDDKATSSNEQSNGRVAMIHLSNFAMDSNTIKSHFTGLGPTLGIYNTSKGALVQVSPNPAKDYVNIAAEENYRYSFFDMIGRVIKQGSVLQGQNRIDITGLPKGVYLLLLEDRTGVKQQYKIAKE